MFSLAGCVGGVKTGQVPETEGIPAPSQQPAAGTAARPAVTAQPATGTPVPIPVVNPALAARLSNTCDLLNSADLASILSTGELQREPVKTSPVKHPVFSTQNVPATEITCLFYEFHNPGKKNEELLQVTYWVDLPGQVAWLAPWQQIWKGAAKSGKNVAGIGDQAFVSSNSRLTFKKSSLYFTLEVVDTSRSADQRMQIARQLAGDMLKRLAAMQASG